MGDGSSGVDCIQAGQEGVGRRSRVVSGSMLRRDITMKESDMPTQAVVESGGNRMVEKTHIRSLPTQPSMT